MTTFQIREDAQVRRWRELFGQDTGSFSAVLRDRNDITHTYFTGNHVDCLIVMRDLIETNGDRFDEEYGPDLLNNETGRLMSWVI